MRFADAVADLDGRQPERMVPDLSRITAIAELLDHPERTYPTIHVSGTNGKTTTARLLSALACAHGLTTGSYTSPHLASVVERMALCGEPISEEEFGEEYGRLLPVLAEVDGRGERVTYFETLTALAYLWFADKPVALGVFEVGMGGVWDATNLVSGDVAVLCPVALDHPELGSTLREVATEKAGIVKEGKIAVSREQPEEALAVIRDRCREAGARLLLEDADFGLAERTPAVGGQLVSIQGLERTYDNVLLPIHGEHAARNAAVAVASLESLLDRELSEDSVRKALADVDAPGRLEVVSRHPLVVLDGAHNPAGAEALVAALPEAFVWDRLFVVLACSANKDIEGIVGALKGVADRVFATEHSSPRSAPAERVADVCRAAGIDTWISGSVPAAVESALGSATVSDLVLVTGSLYTVADARQP